MVAVSVARAIQIEFYFTRQLDDGFRMMAILKEREFERLCAVDEQAAIKAILFLGDPVAAAVLADKSDGRCRTARRRFFELHVAIPCCDEAGLLPETPDGFRLRPVHGPMK